MWGGSTESEWPGPVQNGKDWAAEMSRGQITYSCTGSSKIRQQAPLGCCISSQYFSDLFSYRFPIVYIKKKKNTSTIRQGVKIALNSKKNF